MPILRMKVEFEYTDQAPSTTVLAQAAGGSNFNEVTPPDSILTLSNTTEPNYNKSVSTVPEAGEQDEFLAVLNTSVSADEPQVVAINTNPKTTQLGAAF